MKILFDHQIFSNQLFGGISRYFFELTNELKDNNVFVQISLILSNNFYLNTKKIKFHFSFLKNFGFRGKIRFIYLINKIYSILILKIGHFDVFHPTYYDPYFLKHLGSKKFVLTVYDMIHEKFPEKFPINDKTAINKKLLIDKASKIIAISESTKKDIIDIYKIDSSKIEVVYLSSSLLPSENFIHNKKLPSEYILFVGSRVGYKNFIFFVESISKLLLNNRNLFLVCAGGGVFNSDEIGLFSRLNIDSQLIQINVNDKSLTDLYVNAQLFVFPSLYEGFGIPILESFSCNCPLVCSNTSSFKEIADDAAVFFNPTDENSILASVSIVLNDEKLQRELKKNGINRLAYFSWNKTAMQTKEIYKSLLS